MPHTQGWLILCGGLVISIALLGLLFYESPAVRTETIFVYGTLTNPIIRTVTCRCLASSTPASLAGYQQNGLTIVPAEGAVTRGRLISVSPRALAHLDHYEHVPDRYRRTRVTVAGKNVWVYIRNE